MLKRVESLEQLREYTANMLNILEPGDVLGLRGDLGSGKTAFVRELLGNFGSKEDVTSPTFVIQKSYQLPDNSKFKKLIHIDAYRLDSGEDLNKLGFQELLKEKGSLIVIEWPEKVKDVLPEKTKYLDFKFISDTVREIEDGK